MKLYDHKVVEKKWQEHWYNSSLFQAEDFSKKPKYYALIEFPYPSGAGMHVGHIRAFSSLEIIARKRRMEGYNVLFPIGFDAFGLPTENYAMKTGIHPRVATDNNIKTFTNQLKKTGFSFDFNRVIDTTDESYYHWTQWIFLQLFKKGLAFKNKTYVNYCPTCKVVLANEDSQGGKCDRCDSDVIQKEKDVWFLKITDYSEKMLDGLSTVNYLPRIVTEQENWIGKSVGAEVDFQVKNSDQNLKVFTTRPDTLFGATFMVIAPEHPLVEKMKNKIINLEEISNYQQVTTKKTEFERVYMNKGKTGVEIKGICAINPVNHKEIPIFIADYVMMGYGTGAIMAVPAHDERDFEFARLYHLPIVEVIKGGNVEESAYTNTAIGELINSEVVNGCSVEEAKIKILTYLEEKAIGKKTINYKMKDWAFNRQRYWGEPIPIINCEKCGQVAMKEEDLPLKLPVIDKFEPGEDGESPLSGIDSFVHCKCPKCGGDAKRETDTMPQWAGSSWYYLRYCDPKNKVAFADYEKLKYWMQVDWYNGGMEHVTRHMIYSRFWNHFLYDIGVVPFKEPYAKRTAQGLILGPDGEKMSKSKGNVVDPMDIIEEFGADTLRTYILFLGEYEQPTPWNENGVKGCRRFLEKIYRFQENLIDSDEYSPQLERFIHRTIKEVSNDIENVKFNTAISKLMTLSNEYLKVENLTKADLLVLIKLTYPFAPHICEEINENMGSKVSLTCLPWPTYKEELTSNLEVDIAVQVNGKLRGTFKITKDSDDETMKEMAFAIEAVKAHTNGKEIKKIVIVKNKIVNIVAI